jgi:hypothetical protein
MGWAEWHMFVIAATQEVKVKGYLPEASIGKINGRLYPKNKLKAKRAGGVAQKVDHCLAA